MYLPASFAHLGLSPALQPRASRQWYITLRPLRVPFRFGRLGDRAGVVGNGGTYTRQGNAELENDGKWDSFDLPHFETAAELSQESKPKTPERCKVPRTPSRDNFRVTDYYAIKFFSHF